MTNRTRQAAALIAGAENDIEVAVVENGIMLIETSRGSGDFTTAIAKLNRQRKAIVTAIEALRVAVIVDTDVGNDSEVIVTNPNGADRKLIIERHLSTLSLLFKLRLH